ncbi:hypothetical protein FFWV33_04520 [Flavobacterium faecale]|uniref:Methyltransferase domain-containing protein n=1 Tax=Flavobacterium faecale TaxID=1355330 RepID=A0A2S1LAZ6_9FLAO|nr:class I SAM-dependent methyltransferase [Flavobacterium faecale]AWG20858.1 hypothetical protein FFWV33_04520 [Flavobacterium faecale]
MKELVKHYVGKGLVAIFPEKAKNLSIKGMTIQLHLPVADRLMRNYIFDKAKKENNFEALSNYHKDFWSNKGEDYFLSGFNTDVLESFFKPKCSFLIDSLEEQILEQNENYNLFIEIGTGDGTILKYIKDRSTAIDKFIGIDLSKSQTEANRQRYQNEDKLEFHAADGVEWIKKNGTNKMVVMTSRGVLEYFTQAKLQELFTILSQFEKVYFIAIEPTDVDHDYSKNPDSKIFGFENSFSHNYIKLFTNAGFEIWHQSKSVDWNPSSYMNFIGAKK